MKPECVVCGSHSFHYLFAHQERRMMQCGICEAVQLVPMPTSGEIAKLYHEDFDHFTPYLAQIDVHREYFRKKLAEIRFRVTGDGLRVLDIGCAMGVLLEEGEKFGMGAYGVDISKDAVAYCRKKGLRVYSSFERGRLAKLKFDVVTAFQVIEHERDPLGFLRRIHKLLKKDGMVILATPNYDGWWRRLMGKRWVGFAHPEHVVLLNRPSMRFILEKAGFRAIEIRKDTPRPFPLSFAFTRAADYFPYFASILKPMGKFLDRFHLTNPFNPWDDMIVYAKK